MSNWLQAIFETCPGGVSSAVAPELLPQSQFAWGMNVAVRGGKPHTRPPIVERLVLPSGLHQSSAYFGVQGGMIVTNIQGRIYRLRIGNNSFSWEEIPLGFVNSGIIKQTWMQQTIESLVIQDGQSSPIIYNGSTARRAASDEVPRGKSMAYGNGRLWVAINEKELVAGDIRTRTPGSELKFTETNYLSGGGSLYFPRGITGLEFIPVTGAADFGTLIVFGRDYAESIRADVTSRDMWPQMAGFVTNVFRDIGCAGDWSIVQVNQDLYWRDSRGDIRSLANAISTNNSPGSTPISREVQRLVDFDSDQLLPWVSAIYFDNRLLMTASPYLNVSTGVSFKDIVSLDFSPISTMQLKAPPAYDGQWNGIPGIATLVTGEFDGQNRAFAISSGEDGVNRLWEIMTRGTQDIALSCGSGAMDSPITQLIEYPSINFGGQKQRKRLERCDVWLSDVYGELELTAFWRTDNTQKWSEWDGVETCAKTTDAAVSAPHTWKNLLPEQRPQIKTFTIPDGVDAVTRYGLQVGFEFQIRLVIIGKCQVDKMMIYATPLDDPDYANRETLLTECIENDVTGNEVSYSILVCGDHPLIITQPQSASVLPGDDHTFSVMATGNEPIAYQWKFNGSDLTGENGPNLSLLDISPGNAGNYTVVVSNNGGSVTSDIAVLRVLQDVVITDVTFPLSSWDVVQQGTNVGGVVTVSQVSDGPSGSGTCRQVSNDFSSNAGTVFTANIYNGPLPNNYDPSTRGAVGSIRWQKSARIFNPPYGGAGMGYLVLARQAGQYYFPTVGGDLTFSNTTWQSTDTTIGTAGWNKINIVTGVITAVGPNFTVTGGPIEFGFGTSNTSTAGFTPFIGRFDDWIVTISPTV